uniref:Uncharacterized protein n=1 Tax=Parascaris equorum TaxID=6256 RepID=A0A914R9C8_PAREQ
MKLSYDFRNTSLKTANAHNSPDEMQKSVWGSYFKTNTKIEGPFSHKVTVHENEPVTMVGSREELCEFSERSESSETESRGSRSHNDSSTGASLVNESPHKICVKVCIEEGTLLIGALMTENKVSCGRSEIGAELSGGQLFVVNGYHGNEELTYFYFTTRKAYVFHKSE